MSNAEGFRSQGFKCLGRTREASNLSDRPRFLWRIVSDVFKYAALVVAGKETLVSLRFLQRAHLVIGAMNYNRHADLGQGCQLRLDGRIARIACARQHMKNAKKD